MPGDVDHVVDAAEDAVVAVFRLHRAVARHVWPVAPVLAFRILAVARVVHAHEADPKSKDWRDRKSTRLNSSHLVISYAVFFLKKKNRTPGRCTMRSTL